MCERGDVCEWEGKGNVEEVCVCEGGRVMWRKCVSEGMCECVCVRGGRVM